MDTKRLHFALEEPGEDPLSDQLLDILSDALQPEYESPTTAEEAARQITALLPKGKPYTTEVSSFVWTCFEMAWQIPHEHPLMVKLVIILDLCLNSSWFDGAEEWERFSKLGEAMRACWNATDPDESPVEFIRFNAFIARGVEHGLLRDSVLPGYTLERAFVDREGKTQAGRDACVQAALRYLVFGSDEIYREFLRAWNWQFRHRPRPRWEMHMGEEEWKWYKWRWRCEEVRKVAATQAGSDGCVYSEETVELARQAMAAMEWTEGLKPAEIERERKRFRRGQRWTQLRRVFFTCWSRPTY